MRCCWRLLSASSLIGLALLASASAPQSSEHITSSYQLVNNWHGENFFDGFNFFTAPDPTNGFVNYVDKATAQSTGLIDVFPDGNVYMGVDWTTTLSPNGPGRNSVRIESKEAYETGLFILDLEHMPGSACGSWPAFWTYGPNWPHNGEIDIIEGVHQMTSSQIVLHTSGTCNIAASKMDGALVSTECGRGTNKVGCVIDAGLLTTDHIAVWVFSRGEVPASITEGRPDVSTFGVPRAFFDGACNMAQHFNKQRVVFDVTFCGDWAGGVYAESGCPLSNPAQPRDSCVDFVASNPAAYRESYWEVSSLKVYQGGSPLSFKAAAGSGIAKPAASSSSVAKVAAPSLSVAKASSNFGFAPASRLPTSHIRRSSPVPSANIAAVKSSVAPPAPAFASSGNLIANAMASSPVTTTPSASGASSQTAQFTTPTSSAYSSQAIASKPALCARQFGEPEECTSTDPAIAGMTTVSGAASLRDPPVVDAGSSFGSAIKAPVPPPNDLSRPGAGQPINAPAGGAPPDPPAGPPADPPAGPPPDLPADAPAGPPAGPPADAPPGPPADAPAGPPAGPAGPPADAPAGPPAGLPADAPAGPPAGSPADPPANPPANPPPAPQPNQPIHGPVSPPATGPATGPATTLAGTQTTSPSLSPTHPASTPAVPGGGPMGSPAASPRPSGPVVPIVPSNSSMSVPASKPTSRPSRPASTPVAPIPAPPVITSRPHSTVKPVPSRSRSVPGGKPSVTPSRSVPTGPMFTGAASKSSTSAIGAVYAVAAAAMLI
ncbi:hypothetical protein PHISP_03842 [Aspergillus sp. HF37]|nr:hypothetical protein PHISP_03842 [Aspergillus sp. HF37]